VRFLVLLLTLILASGCGPALSDAPDWNATFQGERLEVGWSGGDAAYTVALPNRRVLWSFGDTLIGEVDQGTRASTEIRFGNSVGVQQLDDTDPFPSRPDFRWGPPGSGGWLPIFEATLASDAAPPSVARAVADGKAFVGWPLHGISVSADLALFHVAVTQGGCQACTFMDFDVHGSTVSVIRGVDRPIDDWGATADGWPEAARPPQRFVPFGDGRIWWGASVLRVDDVVLIYGSREREVGRDVVVAGVDGVTAAADVMDFSRWRFWDGKAWSPSVGDAATVVDSDASEMTVMPVPDGAGHGYALVSGSADFAGDLVVSLAEAPQGPFEEHARLPLGEFLPNGGSEEAAIYAVKAHAALSTDETLLVSYVAVLPDDGAAPDAPSDSRYYVPRFVRVPWGIVTGVGGPPW
jgi:hypothetical protein